MTTQARPGDLVLVTGAGPVGYLGAHLFRHAGYAVTVVDPEAGRRDMVRASGIGDVFEAVPVETPGFAGSVALALECSGHERAVLDACRVVRKNGEVVLVGVPWRPSTKITSHELLWEVFHRYVVLRSGWEWSVPRHEADFQPHSIFGGYERALDLLRRGAIPLEGLIKVHDPRDAGSVYDALHRRSADGLFQVFDWTLDR
jgi:threonine dehydrogenase-like Zn-dependent dehydrogenase